MSLTSAKSSTPDAGAGTAVAGVTSEVGSVFLQSVTEAYNKTTWSENSRTSISSADAPTGGDMTTSGFAGSSGANLFDLENAGSCQIRATSTSASKTLTGRLALYDGSNACIGYSETITITTDATLRLGNASGDFVGRANIIVDVAGARKARFFVDGVGGGTWAIYTRPI